MNTPHLCEYIFLIFITSFCKNSQLLAEMLIVLFWFFFVKIKINIDENPNTPTQFGVRGIPTMLVFKNGEAAATKVGAVSKTAIVEWIEDSIA